MSVNFHLMTRVRNRVNFIDSSMTSLTDPCAIGLSPQLISSDGGGVHWSSAFPDILGMSEADAKQSEGYLWESNEPNAQFRLSYMISRMTAAMQMTDVAKSGYGSRLHQAHMLSLLQAAQMYAALHPDEVFIICWH